MISFSQLNEQVYVDRMLSESFLAEEVGRHLRSVEDQMAIDTNRNKGRKEVEIARKEADKVRKDIRLIDERIAKFETNERRYIAKIEKEIKQAERDRSLSAEKRDAKIRQLENMIDERRASTEIKKAELEKEKSDKVQIELSAREIEKTTQERIKAGKVEAEIKLERQKLEAERDLNKEIRRAERSFEDVLRGAAIGTVEGLGRATAYSAKSLFSFVAQNPLKAAGVSTAIVIDQLLFNNAVMRNVPLVGGGVIPNFVGWVIKLIANAGSSAGQSAALAVIVGIAPILGILAASGIGLYAAYKLIRILLDLGEAKALQIAKRLERASEDEMEEILRRELNVNTRKLKKQRA
jgi:hypothetical protein